MNRYCSRREAYLGASVLLLSWSAAFADTADRVDILARFWEYSSQEVHEAITAPWTDELTPEQVAALSDRNRRAYRLLLASACSDGEPDEYRSLHAYKCRDAPLYVLFNESLGEPRALLFTNREDVSRVAGYLGRYVEFLQAERSTRGGMAIEASVTELLLEIQRILVDTTSPTEGGG